MGKPVVPEVYWMLIGSVGESRPCSSVSRALLTWWAPPRNSSHAWLPITSTCASVGQSRRTSSTIAG